jgi:glutaredoxin
MSLSKWGRSGLKALQSRVLSAADRADERGGELRDRLVEKVKNSKKLEEVRKVVRVFTEPLPAPAPASPSPVQKPLAPEVFSFGDPRKQAQVFGSRTCTWSGRCLRLFEQEGIQVSYVDLDLGGGNGLREELETETGQVTVPFVYLRGRFIGCYNELDEIHRLGRLSYEVLEESERLAHPDHGKFEIATRPGPGSN